jgi:fructose/tagatose bisphosphate aldolase
VEQAHRAGVWVEAELAGVAGEEDASSDAVAGELTDPEQAAEFVRRTGVDALAAAVGTVHGFTAVPVHIDFERLRAIERSVPVPLVLHGASGLDPGELTAAVAGGIAKVNINAELRRGYLAALSGALNGSDDIPRLQDAAVAVMTDIAAEKLTFLARHDDKQERAR